MAQREGRVIALLFHDRGTRRLWVVSSTFRPQFTPGKDPVPILQEAVWAPGKYYAYIMHIFLSFSIQSCISNRNFCIPIPKENQIQLQNSFYTTTPFTHHHHHHHNHHISVMELCHLLTRSGLTYPEVSSKVYHDSFCQLGSSVYLSGFFP